MGVVSSRTPEGDPGLCPVCGHDCRLDPSWPARDGPCPSCGHLLWFDPPDRAANPDARDVVLRLGKVRWPSARQDPPALVQGPAPVVPQYGS